VRLSLTVYRTIAKPFRKEQATGSIVEPKGRSLANFHEDDGIIRSGSKHVVSLTDYVILLRTLLPCLPPPYPAEIARPLSSFDRSTNIRE